MPPRPPRQRSSSSERTFGSGAHCYRKTRSHQDKPNPKPALAHSSRDPPHRPLARAHDALADAPACYASVSGISPLYDVKICRCALARRRLVTRLAPWTELTCCIRMDELVEPDGIEPTTSCLQSSALPTELWPRTGAAHAISGDQRSQTPGPSQRMMWWAWEDLNFRPHAYQARALTN